jgi:DNA repair exonuclease SbcCD ATPase subunit
MSTAYLKRVSIQNFRAYGEFTVELPGPGVTILLGPNGLGKSSFFESIEWALTGRIERLEKLYFDGRLHKDGDLYLDNHLARLSSQEKPASKFGVILDFGEFGKIQRVKSRRANAAAFTEKLSPSEQEVKRLICDDRWMLQIDDLNAYLRTTHFLAQSTRMRLASRDPKERWQDVQGPAGMLKLSTVGARLGGGTTRALHKAQTSASDDLESARKNLKRWDELISRRDKQREIVTGGGAVSNEDANRIVEQLADILRGIGAQLAAWDRTEMLDQRIQRVAAASADFAVRLQTREEQLKSATDLPDRFRRAVGSAERAQAALDRAQRARDEAAKRERGLRGELEQVGAGLERDEVTRRDTERRIGGLIQLREAIEALERARAELAVAQSEYESARERSDNVLARLREAEEKVISTKKIEARLLSVLSRAETLAQLRGGIVLAREKLRESEAEVPTRVDKAKKLASLSEEIGGTADRISRARTTLQSKEVAVLDLRKKATVIQGALATLAAALDEHDTTCPVCSTPWAPDELKQRAEKAAQRESMELAHAEQELTVLRQELEREHRQHARQSNALDALRRDLQQIDARQVEANTAWQSALRVPELAGRELDPEVALEEHLNNSQEIARDLRHQIATIGGSTQLEHEVASVRAEAKRLTDHLAVLHTRLQAARRQTETALATVSSRERAVAASDRSDLVMALRVASELLDACRKAEQEQLARKLELQARHVEAKSGLEDADVGLSARKKDLDAARSNVGAHHASWATLDLVGNPDEAALTMAKHELNTRRVSLTGVRTRLDELKSGREKWILSEELRLIEGTPTRLVGA